nr:zinc-ribbon domain-containing protein [Trichocoleus sp. FACHB-591]
MKEQEKAEAAAEQKKEERAKQELYSRSLAALYPERASELWDYEKNGDLKPENVPAGTTQQYVWFKCPHDGYSWKKKPSEIAKQSWDRNGTSGCPMCAGKKKKAEKQPVLTEVYPEFIEEHWNYKKNNELNLDPEKLTLASNKKVWFKCPQDGNEWQASIVSTITQQWSKGNTGCRVCNGTAERKRGKWQRRDSVAVEFPEEVAKYWCYEVNNKLELDPIKLTIGSGKEASFKCPIDDHEWVAKIATIAKHSWKKGNSGCPACRGLIATETTSLLTLYPEYVSQYWDYEKNNKLDVFPDKVTRGSQQEAWFKCPHDEYEWKARVGTITRRSWNLGNNGCARCFGWNLEAIRQFVASLESHIPNLTQAELYKIFEQSGILDTKNIEALKLVKDIIRSKLTGQKLRDVIQGKESKTSGTETDSIDVLKADTELQIVDASPSLDISDIPQSFEANSDSQGELDEASKLPKIKVQKSLEFLSSKIVASADQEAVDFFIASRRNRIWAEVFEDESAVEAIEAFTDEGYGRQVRDQFLEEYNQARDMAIPSGWAFRVDGKITPPNLMQKLASVRLRSQRRMLNLSLTGTGKTIGGILSSRIIDAHLTIIICPLDTVTNWHGEIKQVFPDSQVTIKNFSPHWTDIEGGHHYILLHHEMFQQPSTSAHIRQLLERYQIDFIIVDEIHRCKQRSDDPSKRRQMVLALITNAAEKNPDLHVLGMSATPVINNLKEGKSLVELVTGIERSDLGEKATLNNCMRLHQSFVTLGIRSRVKPKINIKRVTLPVDCTHLVDEIWEEGTSILKMEQILTRARIPAILKELRPKTVVYTHYVEGIVDQLKEAIEGEGWTVGFHMGGDKSGRNNFIDGSIDILIASSAMATGIDGFQRVCDRLILNIPPWTSAELEQLEGRLNRQGQVHDTLTILMPVTYSLNDGERWSWDEGRLARLQNKQTVADAAVDGKMPEGQLRSESQAFRDLRKWLERLKSGEQRAVIHPKIFVPLPNVDPLDVRRRNVQYGDFSRMNARWSSSYSHTTYERLQGNPEEWMQYHTLYQEARKTWSVIPYEEAIKWLQKRSDLVVADFGCGEALIAKALVGKHTIHNFDFIAINDSVIECDMARVPLEDSCLDVAMFNLSLMGLNITDYIREASRTLKLDGQLWIYEVTSHIKDFQGFVKGLETAGFKIIETTEVWKFRYIRAIKSEEVDISQIKVHL